MGLCVNFSTKSTSRWLAREQLCSTAQGRWGALNFSRIGNEVSSSSAQNWRKKAIHCCHGDNQMKVDELHVVHELQKTQSNKSDTLMCWNLTNPED